MRNFIWAITYKCSEELETYWRKKVARQLMGYPARIDQFISSSNPSKIAVTYRTPERRMISSLEF
jgi:hypothetical protein